MPSLDAGSRWLDEKLGSTDVAGQAVEVEVGGETINCTAVPGMTPIGFDLGNGILQTWQTQDFLIAVDELVLHGETVEPEQGMRIIRTVNGERVPFKVLATEDGRCWRWSDGVTRSMRRIHTKEGSGKEPE